MKIKIKQEIESIRRHLQESGHEKKVFAGGLFALGFMVALSLSGGGDTSYQANILATSSEAMEKNTEDESVLPDAMPEKKEILLPAEDESLEEGESWTEKTDEKPKRRVIGLTDRMTDEEIAATFTGLWGSEEITIPEEENEEEKKDKPKPAEVIELEDSSPVESVSVTEIDVAEEGVAEKVVPQEKKEVAKTPAPEKKKEEVKEIVEPVQKEVSPYKYENGTYSAVGSYKTDSGKHESISVRITLESDLIKSITVAPLSKDSNERGMQATFAGDVSVYVHGEHLDNVPVFSAVDGGSFVPKGFQRAIASIRAQAK